MIDTAALRAFHAIARAGSITGGAQSLGVSQSTASTTLAALEEALGTTLFLRSRSVIQPTQAGQLLLDRVDSVFAGLDEIVSDIRDLEHEATGSFVFGCHDPLGSYFLPDFLDSFLQEYPRIQLQLWNRTSAEVLQAVIQRRVHFGLVVNASPHDDLVMRKAFRDRIVVFGPEPLSLSEAIEAFATGTLVYPDRAPFTNLLSELHNAGCRFGRLLPTGDLGLTRTLARRLGFGLLPRRVALDGDHDLRPLCPDLPYYDDTISLVYRADQPKTRAAKLLRDGLIQHSKTLCEEPGG